MKKLLLSLFSVMLLAFAAKAGDPITVDFTINNNAGWEGQSWSNSYATRTMSTADYKVTFSAASNQTGTITDVPVTKASTVIFQLLTAGETLDNITVNFKQWKTNTQTIKMYYSTDGETYTQIGSSTTTINFTTVKSLSTGTLPEGVTYVKFETTGTNQIGWASLEYTLVDKVGDNREVVEMSFPEANYTAETGSEFTAPELTVTPEAAKAEVKYSSSNTDVATVDETSGAVTILAKGTTTITAQIAGSTNYKNAKAQYDLKVTVPADPFTIDFCMKGDDMNPNWDNATWSTSYTNHVLSTVDYKVTMTAVSTQTAVVGYPVAKATDVIFELLTSGQTLGNVTLKFTPYNNTSGNPKTNSATVSYSLDGKTYKQIGSAVTINFNPINSINTGELPDGVKFVKFSTTNTSNQIGIESLHYELAVPDEREYASLSFPTNIYYAGLNQEFTAPELTVTPEAAKAEVKYSSSNTAVATVDETTGAVTVLAKGTVVITAQIAGSATYRDEKAQYELTVVNELMYSIADVKALASGTECSIGFETTVGYVNASNVFVTDGAEWIQIYSANSFKIGDVIPAGWTCTYTLYNENTPELTNTSKTIEFPDVYVNNAEINFKEFTENVTVANVNQVVIFKNVKFDTATPSNVANFDGLVNLENEVNFRNNYSIASVDAGVYDVKCVITIYQNAPSRYVISYTKAKSTAPFTYDYKSQYESGDQIYLQVAPGFDIYFTLDGTMPVIPGYTAASAPRRAATVVTDTYSTTGTNKYIPGQPITFENEEIKLRYQSYAEGFDPSDVMELNVSADGETTGIESVAADAAAPVEYFNLQGIRVDNPSNGVFIRRQGNNTIKIKK